MQRRHFEAVARAVARYGKAHAERRFMPDVLAEMIADEIGQFSANFDQGRFIRACKPEEGWPRWIDGTLTYACCVSTIDQPCHHKSEGK